MASTNINEDIDRINDALDIVDLVRNSPKAFNFQGSGDRYTACTSCSSQSGASLIITPSEGKWHDKATGEGGLAFNWLAYELLGTSRPRGKDVLDVLKVAAEKAGITLSDYSESDKKLFQEKEAIISLFEQVNHKWVDNLQNNPEILEDLKKRHGLTAEQAKEHGIGYAIGNEDLRGLDNELLVKSGLVYSKFGKRANAYFQHRIMYPYKKNGRIIYFAGRLTAFTPEWDRGEKDSKKYKKLQTAGEDRLFMSYTVQNDTIYGQDTIRGKDFVVITEGIGDCLALHCAGIPAISPITTTFPKHDVPKLLELAKGKHVYIANDSEESEAGEKGALATAKILEKEGITATIVIIPRAEGVKKIDVAEYLRDNSAEDFKELLTSENAVGLWNRALAKKVIPKNVGSIEKIRAYRSFIENDLSEMKPDEWEIFVTNEVREKFGLDKKEIKNTVSEVLKRRQNKNKTESSGREAGVHGGAQGNGEEGQNENKRYTLPPLEERLEEYPEEVVRKANEILDNGDPFLFICNTWNELHVGDRNLGEMLACSIACTQLLNAGLGIHEKPSGDAESGKSHACLSMGKLCPTWKFRATTFTPKVLYYMNDLLPGTIIYTDDINLGDDGVISTVKKMTADFENETIMDTVIDGKAATRSIPERMGIWLSSVDSITDVQLGTRFIYSNTENEAGHDHEVNHKQKGRCLGAVPEEYSERFLICRCMLEYICDDLYNVFSAYGFVSTWSEESQKRNQEKFLDVLLSVTVFKYRQRETFNGNLVGTREDWDRAFSIYSHVAQNNSSLLTDEEIVILHSIFELCPHFDEGVPHKQLFDYMKKTGRFKKSDSTLKRILLGDTRSGKQGFKEKVPGFTFEKITMPKLDENGFEIKGTGSTHVLCYSYDGDLFDGLPEGEDVVTAIKNRTFVNCDYELAESLERTFKEAPAEVYNLKDNSGKLENWKKSLRNQKDSSEIHRNPQKSNAVISEENHLPHTINNNKNDNNNLRIHEIGEKGGIENNMCVCVPSREEETNLEENVKTHAILPPLNSGNSWNSGNSEAPACDHGLNSEKGILNSEASDSDSAMNSEVFESNHILNAEPADSDHSFDSEKLLVNSETVNLNSETSEINRKVCTLNSGNSNSPLSGVAPAALAEDDIERMKKLNFLREELKVQSRTYVRKHGGIDNINDFVELFLRENPGFRKSWPFDTIISEAERVCKMIPSTKKTTVVNLRNTHDYDVYIGRAHKTDSGKWIPKSKWQNPFRIGKDGNREEVIAKYVEHLWAHPDLIQSLPELKNKILGCWCNPEPCHGDYLARLANDLDFFISEKVKHETVCDQEDSGEVEGMVEG